MANMTTIYQDQVKLSLKKFNRRLKDETLPAETLILELSNGFTIESISEKYKKPYKTVSYNLERLKTLFRVKNTVELCCIALRLKIIE